MASDNWIGGSGDWSDAFNWQADQAPASPDSVNIAGGGTFTVEIDEAVAAADISLESANATLDVSSAASLTLAETLTIGAGSVTVEGIVFGGIINDPNGDLHLNGGTLDGVTYEGDLRLTIANSSAFAYDGLTVVGEYGYGPGAIDIAGDDASLTVHGALNLSGSAGSPSTILLNSQGATLDLEDSQTLDQVNIEMYGNANAPAYFTAGYGVTLVLGPNSQINSQYNGDISGYGTIVNQGYITDSYNSLTVDVLVFVNEGTLEVGSYAYFYVTSGDFLNLADDTLTGGSYVVDGGYMYFGSQIAALDADFTLESGGEAYGDGVAIEATLTSVGAEGALRLLGGQNYSTLNTLNDSGLVQLAGGALSTGGLTISGSGSLIGYGAVQGPLVNDDIVTASGGDLQIEGDVSGTGEFVIGSGAELELGAGADSANVSFGGTIGRLILDDPRGFSGAISGLTAGDVIDFAGETASFVSLSGGVLTVLANGGEETFDVSGALAGETFSPVSDGAGGTDFLLENVNHPTIVSQPIVGYYNTAQWTSPSSWLGGSVPTVDDNVAIVGLEQNAYFYISSPTAADDVTFASQGAYLDISSPLTLTGALTVESGTVELDSALSAASVAVSGGLLDISYGGSLDAGTLTVTGGTVELNDEIVGTTIDVNGGILDLAYGTLDDVTFVGPLQISGNAYVTVTNGMTVTGAGEVDFADDAQLTLESGPVQVGDAGEAGVVNLNGANSHLYVEGAELSLGGSSSAGAINIAGTDSAVEFSSGGFEYVSVINVTGAGAVLQFDYDQSIDDVTINLGGESGQAAPTLNHESSFGVQPLTLGSSVTVNQIGAAAAINGDYFNISGAAVVAAVLGPPSPSSYSPNGIVNDGVINATYLTGALAITGQFINDGALNVANGETVTVGPGNLGGEFINALGGQINISADGSGGSLVVDGDTSWSNQGLVTIGSGGLLDIRGQIYAAAPASPVSLGAVQLNGGELEIESAIATSQLDDVVNSGGVVDFNSALSNSDEILDIGSGTNLGGVVFDKGAVITGGSIVDNANDAKFFGATLNNVAYEGAITLGAGEWLWLENFTSDDIVDVETGGTLYLWTASPDSPITPGELGGIANEGGVVVIDGRYDNSDDTLTIGAGTTLGQVEFDQGAVITGGSIVDSGAEAQFFGATFDDVTYQGVITLGADESLTLENFTSATEVNVEAGGALYLGADASPPVTPQELAGITNSGGTVVFEGWFDNDDDTLDIGAGQPLGQVTVDVNGTIAGGVVDDAAGDIQFTGGTLDNVAVQGTITVAAGEWLRMDNWVAGTSIDITGGEVDLFGPSPASPGSPPVAPYSAPLNVDLSTGELDIDGEVGAATLVGVDNSGGQILIFGTLDNASDTLDIGEGAQLGRVVIENGGAIDGGTIDDAGLGLLFSPNSIASLNGVVYEGDLRLLQTGLTLDVADGLTVEGAGGAGGEIDLTGNYSVLSIDGGLTIGSLGSPASINIGGNAAQIVFESSEALDDVTITNTGAEYTTETISARDTSGVGNVLTFGANVLIQSDGGALAIESGAYADDAVVNYGVVGGDGGQVEFLGYIANYGVIDDTGYFNSSVSFSGFQGVGSFTNAGTLNVEDEAFENVTVNFVNTASGVVNLGYFSGLSLGSSTTTWSNAGAIHMGVDSYLDLYGAFVSTGLDGVTSATNSGIYIFGAMNNADEVFDVGAGTTLGSNVVSLDGGEITGGTIRDSGSGLEIEHGTLDDVVYQGTLSLNGDYYDPDPLNIVDGLTVESLSGTGPGLILLNGYDKTLNFENSGTLDDVTVDIGTTYGGDDVLAAASGATLTLGPTSVLNASGYNSYLNGAGAIVEQGAINAEYSNGSFYVDVASFTEQGSILVAGGTTIQITPTVFTNLANGVLTSGVYEVDSGSKLELANGATITTLAADITLSGGGSVWETAGAVTLESTLTEIAGAGALNVLNNRNYVTTNNVEVAGALTLGGGAFTAASLTIDQAATFSGFGAVTGLDNNGLITATGGTLDIAGAVTGGGRADIASGAEMEIGGPVAAGQTVSFGGAVGVLKLDDPADFKGAITGLVAGDTIDLAGATVTGFTLSPTALVVDTASGSLSLALSGDLNGLTFSPTSDGAGGTDLTLGAASRLAVPSLSATSPIALANVRVNTTDGLLLGVTNIAGSGAGALDVSVASATGGLQAIGSINQLGPGQTAYIDIVAPSGSAGAVSGSVVLDFSSEEDGVVTPLPSQTLEVSGVVYRLATAVVSAPTSSPIVHVGDAASESLIVVNTAATDGYSEGLVGSAGSASNGFTVSGTTGDIAPNASSDAISVAIPTSKAGALSSNVSVNLTSDGLGVDGLGGASLGSQTVTVNAVVDNYAAPDFQKVVAANSDSGKLIENSSTSYSFNFGELDPDGPTIAADFALLNNAGLVADLLSGDYTISPTTVVSATLGTKVVAPGTIFDQAGFDSFSNLHSDTSGLPLEIDFDPVGDYGDNATFDETITLHPTGSNASGYSGALSPVTLNISGAVSKSDPPDAAEIKASPDPINFGPLHDEQAGYPGAPQITLSPITVTNGAKIGAAYLSYYIAGVTGPGILNGGPSGSPLPPQTGELATVLSLSPLGSPLALAPGEFEGVVSFGGASLIHGGIVSPLPEYENVDYNGEVYEYAKPVIEDNVGDLICYYGTQVTPVIYLPTVHSPTTFYLYASNEADPDYGDKLEVSSSLTGPATGINYSPSDQTLDGGAQGIVVGVIQVTQGASFSNPATITITDYNESEVPGFSGNLPDPTELIYANYSPSPPPPPPPAPKPPPPPPSPNGNGGGGGGWGDVHLITFSGLHYDFQAAGEFVAAKATDPTDPFQVQIRLQPYYTGSSVTVTTQIATMVGADDVTFDIAREAQGQGFVWVDGAALTLSAADPTYQLSGGVIAYVGPGTYKISYDKGETLLVSDEGAFLNFNITLGPDMGAGSVTGLDGVDAANAYNDLVLGPGAGAEAGTVLDSESLPTSELYGQYADSWRVSPASSLFYYAPGQSTATFTDKQFPTNPLSINQIPAAVVAQATYLATQAGITDPTLLEDAILDYAETGNIDFITGAANLQSLGVGETAKADAGLVYSPPTAVASIVTVQTSIVQTPDTAATAKFLIELNTPALSPVTIDYAAVDPGAGYLGASALGGSLPSGVVTFTIGEQSAEIDVAVSANALGADPADYLQMQISAPSTESFVALGAPVASVDVKSSVAQPGVPADIALEIATGSAVLEQNGDDWTLNLGSFAAGATFSPIEIAVANTAAATADQLSGQARVVSGDAALTQSAGAALGGYANLAGGAIADAAVIDLDTAAGGVFTEVLSFSAIDVNASGYSNPLTAQTLTITGTVTAVAPTLAGTVAGQATSSEAPLDPFSDVTIGDANAGATDTLTITLSGGGGTLADGAGFAGLSFADDAYSLTGDYSAITAELRALVFTATAGEPGATTQTDFQLTLRSSAFATPTTDTTTSVVDSDLFAAVTVSQYDDYRAQLDATGSVTISDAWAQVQSALDVLSGDVDVKAIDLTDASAPAGLTIDAAQAENDLRALGLISAPWSYSITVEDSVADVAGLIAQAPVELDALSADKVTRIATTGGGSTLTVAEALALEGAGIGLAAAEGYSDILVDTAAHLKTLTPAEIAALTSLWVTQLQATDVDVSFTAAQLRALGAAGITLRQPFAGGSYEIITLEANGFIHDIAYAGVVGAQYTSFDVVYGVNDKPASATYSNGMTETWTYNGDGSLHDVVFAGVTGASYTSYEAFYNANGTIHDIEFSGVTGESYTSYDVVRGANNEPVSAVYSNGMTEAWTYNTDGSLRDVAYAGVEGARYTAYDIVYNVNGTIHDIDYSGITGEPYTSYDVVRGANNEPVSAVYSNGMTEAWTYNSDGSLRDVAYAGVEGARYTAYDIVYNANGTIHDIDYSGITGEPYTSYDVVRGPNNEPANAVYSNGMTETWTYNNDGSLHDVAFAGVEGASFTSYDIAYGANGKPESATYSNGVAESWTYNNDGSYEILRIGLGGNPDAGLADLYSAANLHIAEASDVSLTSGALQLFQNDLTVSEGSGALSVVSGSDTFGLNDHLSQSIAMANSSGDAFHLTSGFGKTSISGFAAGGANSDTLDFQLAMFDASWFTPGMTMDDEAVALLNHATGTTNTVITDNAGDTLTLIGVSRTALTNNPETIRLT
jgi:hypothetical protein